MKSFPYSQLWFSCPKPSPKAQLRLFCFPCAGGLGSAFRPWSEQLFPDIEVYSVQLPGRSQRIQETPFIRISSLVKTLVPHLVPYLDRPYAFVGHSLGAIIGFETARQLRRQDCPPPRHFLACASAAPQVSLSEPNIHKLPKNVFLKEVSRRYRAIPKAIEQDDKLMELFLPSLRGDFTMLETYSYTAEAPLECPISIFGGFGDSTLSYQDLESWHYQTCSSFNLKMFPGDHFFLHNSHWKVKENLADLLTAASISSS